MFQKLVAAVLKVDVTKGYTQNLQLNGNIIFVVEVREVLWRARYSLELEPAQAGEMYSMFWNR